MQFELKGREGMDALNTNLAPPFRVGLAGAAVSADVADRLARSRVAGQLAAAVTANGAAAKAAAAKAPSAKAGAAKAPAAKAAAATVVSVVGMSQEGGSSATNEPVLGAEYGLQPVAKAPTKAKAAPTKAPPKITAQQPTVPIARTRLGQWGDRWHRARRTGRK